MMQILFFLVGLISPLLICLLIDWMRKRRLRAEMNDAMRTAVFNGLATGFGMSWDSPDTIDKIAKQKSIARSAKTNQDKLL